jgi:aspartate/methionine/tyrosine aminotransferase
MNQELISKRAREIPPFIVMEIMEKAKALESQGQKVIHMEIGEPDFSTPEVVKEAARRAIEADKTQYTHSLGLYKLRKSITNHYFSKYEVEISPDRVIITEGTSTGMLLVFAAIIDLGDQVILSNPCYSCYPNFVKVMTGEPVFVRISEEGGFEYQASEIKKQISSNTRAIMINSPANPTGVVLSEQTMKEIAALATDNCLVVSDEIYHGMVYEGKEHTILEYTDKAVVINGFSKLYAMTGWRLGYLIVPDKLIRPIQKLQQNLFIAANTIAQWAAIAAIEEAEPEVKKMVSIYNERRQFLIPRLRELGFGVSVEPTGAFYILVNCREFMVDSYKFAMELLEKAKVAVTPGIDFGSGAEGYLRFSYANSLENLEEGCRRLEVYLERG